MLGACWGHAGFLLTHGSTSLLCDPWVNESGAFLNSWHQFPPNDFIEKQELYEVDYLYISHMHQDHFDKNFLKSYPKDKVTVVIASFLSDSFFQDIRELGFPRIVQLADWEELSIGNDFSITMFRDKSLYKVHSSALLRTGETTILNRNDCYISLADAAKFRAIGIDILFSQFSGAIWYPAVYGYETQKEREISAEIRKNLLNGFVAFVNEIDPKHVFYSAGPPCFLEENLFRLNFQDSGIFHDQNDVYADLCPRVNGNLQIILPGDLVGLGNLDTLDITNVRFFDFSRKRELLTEYMEKRAPLIQAYFNELPLPGEGFIDRFQEHVDGLFSINDYLRNRVNSLVKFTITGQQGGCVYLDTRADPFTISQSSSDQPNYELTISSQVARLLVDREAAWEDVLLGMRIQARRDPDVYNWPLFAILQFSRDPVLLSRIEEVMRESEQETILVKDNDQEYRIQRFCPHMGEDLSTAAIVDGKITCPRHHWTFDLRKHGTCISGGNVPVQIYEQLGAEEMAGQA